MSMFAKTILVLTVPYFATCGRELQDSGMLKIIHSSKLCRVPTLKQWKHDIHNQLFIIQTHITVGISYKY